MEDTTQRALLPRGRNLSFSLLGIETTASNGGFLQVSVEIYLSPY